jgi:hypothetical protein
VRLPKMMGSCVVVLGLAVGGSAWGAGVSPLAATPEQKQQALTRFLAGKKAVESKNWSTATAELRSSLDIVDSPNARFILARALRDSGALSDAWSEYGRVIDDGNILSAKEPAYQQTVDAATSERAEIEGKLAFVIVTVTHVPAGAAVRAGGRTVPSETLGSPFVVSPGAVDVVVENGGKELARKTVKVSLGDKTQVNLDAAPPPAAGTPPPPDKDDLNVPGVNGGDSDNSPAAAPGTSGRGSLRPWAYVAGGVGAAGMVTFTVAGLMNNAAYNDLKNTCHYGCPPSKQSEENNGKTEQTIANVGLVVGIAGLAAGTALFILSRPSAPSAGTAIVVGPGYLGLRGSL